MAYTVSAQISGTALSNTYTMDASVSANILIGWNESLAVAKNGTLTTFTDSTHGTLTMAAGHGITTGAKLDLYWSGGAQVGMTAGTVSVNSVPISGGTGSGLPAVNTVITAQVPIQIAMAVTGNNVAALVAHCDDIGNVAYCNSSGTVLFNITFAAGQDYIWTSEMGVTNPLTGDAVDHILISHASSTAAMVHRGATYYN